MAARKLNRDYHDLTSNPILGVNIELIDNNIKQWRIQIDGPEDSLYHDDVFEILLTFQDDFPKNPPKVEMKTPIVHQNVSSGGAVCIDVLRTQFNPTITVRQIIEGLINMLNNPNEKERLNAQVGDLMKNDYEAFKEQVRKQVMLNVTERAKL